VNCSTLRERTAGSPPSTSQVSLHNQFGDLLMSRSTNTSGSLCYGRAVPRDAHAVEILPMLFKFQPEESHWAEAHIKIVKMTLTIKFNRNWSSFQLANRAPPLSVTDSFIAPSARMSGRPIVRFQTWIKNGAGRLRGHTQGRDASSNSSFRCVCVCVCFAGCSLG